MGLYRTVPHITEDKIRDNHGIPGQDTRGCRTSGRNPLALDLQRLQLSELTLLRWSFFPHSVFSSSYPSFQNLQKKIYTKRRPGQLPVGYSAVVGRPYAVTRDGLDCTLPFFSNLSNLTKFSEEIFSEVNRHQVDHTEVWRNGPKISQNRLTDDEVLRRVPLRCLVS